jgi:hypothetical protein
MPKFAANLSMLFTELPFLDRFTAAAQADSRVWSSCSLMTEAIQMLANRINTLETVGTHLGDDLQSLPAAVEERAGDVAGVTGSVNKRNPALCNSVAAKRRFSTRTSRPRPGGRIPTRQLSCLQPSAVA